jgi:Protein of unknown function (DUF4238)
MSEPKLHHYVPRFYLKYFCDRSNRFWVWDKKNSGKVFCTNPNKVAAGTHFYRVPQFIGTEVDPLFLEKDLASLEAKTSQILQTCSMLLDTMEPLQYLQMDDEERWTLSSFIAVQFLRTAEQRDILALFALKNGFYKDGLSHEEKIDLHAQMLCSGGLVEDIAQRVFDSVWIYARNRTITPFWTSDNPVAFKTADNRMWLKGPGIFSSGSYVVFPITPSYVLYCKEQDYWSALSELDSCLSPVDLTDEMVQHENAGQVFMATRHVISISNEFSLADEFVKSIGTDMYAPKDI